MMYNLEEMGPWVGAGTYWDKGHEWWRREATSSGRRLRGAEREGREGNFVYGPIIVLILKWETERDKDQAGERSLEEWQGNGLKERVGYLR